MTLEINELNVQISVVSGNTPSDLILAPSPALDTRSRAEITREVIQQSVAEVLSRLRRMEVR